MPSKGPGENEPAEEKGGGTTFCAREEVADINSVASQTNAVESWNDRFLEMMREAPPAALTSVKNYFRNDNISTTADHRNRQLQILTQEEADAMEAGIPNPQQHMDRPGTATTPNPENEKTPPSKLPPPKQNPSAWR
jgi:hypothetical protein